jgi:hypothetical protein
MQVVIGSKTLYHDKLGALRPGRVVELDDRTATRYLTAGAVERYETKVIQQNPLPNAGAAEPSPASPADPVSPTTTLQPSVPGGKRRGRQPRRS